MKFVSNQLSQSLVAFCTMLLLVLGTSWIGPETVVKSTVESVNQLGTVLVSPVSAQGPGECEASCKKWSDSKQKCVDDCPEGQSCQEGMNEQGFFGWFCGEEEPPSCEGGEKEECTKDCSAEQKQTKMKCSPDEVLYSGSVAETLKCDGEEKDSCGPESFESCEAPGTTESQVCEGETCGLCG